MKKNIAWLVAIAIAVCSGLPALPVRGDAVSSQIIGFQCVTLLPGHNFVGLNFKNGDSGGFDVQKLFDTAPLKGGDTRDDADRLILWDATAQQYVDLWLFDSGGGQPDLDGKWIDPATGGVASRTVSPGNGFWLLNTADAAVKVVLAGDVEAAASVAHTVAAGYNLIASAWPVDKTVGEMNLDGCTGGLTRATADRIILWDAAARKYVELWRFDSGGAQPAFDGTWIDRATGDVAGPERVIPAGTAVWVIRRTAGELAEAKPF